LIAFAVAKDCLFAIGDDFQGETFVGVVDTATGAVNVRFVISPQLVSVITLSLYDPARNVFFVVWIAEDSNKNQLQYFSAMNASSGSMLQTKLTDVGFGDRIQQISLDAVSGDVFAIRGPIGVNNMTLNRIYQGSSIVNEWILSFPYQWTVSVLAQGNGFVANGTLIALMQEGNYGVLASIDLQSWHINYWTVPNWISNCGLSADGAIVGVFCPASSCNLEKAVCGFVSCDTQFLRTLPPYLGGALTGGASSSAYYWADFTFRASTQNLWSYSLVDGSPLTSVALHGWPSSCQGACLMPSFSVFESANCI